MTMIFTLLPSNSIRENCLQEIRDNFLFLRENGSVKEYTYDKIAGYINQALGLRLHKSDARKFLLGTYGLSRAPVEGVVRLLDFSRSEKMRLENSLSGVFNDVVVSIPVTPALVEAFEKCDDLAGVIGPEATERIRQAIERFKLDYKG